MSMSAPRSPVRAPLGGASWVRVANIVLGIWLFISAFAWQHTAAQMTNTWIVGVVAIVFAGLAFAYSQARYVNTLLAIWLFISAFALPRITGATAWNNAIVAILMFAFSLVPSESTRPGYAGRASV
jgi:hypothetical protein